MRRIAVLMGGESQERDVSRVTGVAVAEALAARGHSVTLLDTREGPIPLESHGAYAIGRRPPGSDPSPDSGSFASPEERQVGLSASPGELIVPPAQEVARLAGSFADVDVVFIALHGGWGEDGTIQAFFELAGIPYTGSGVLGSALAMDKDRAKRVLRSAGVRVPDGVLVEPGPEGAIPEAERGRIVAELGEDLIVKPNREGSTVGLRRVGSASELPAAILHAAAFGPVLVERFVPGRELTVGILGSEVLPVVEIQPKGGLYTYEAKYTEGQSRYVCPAELPEGLTHAIRGAAWDAFRALGCEGFARVDFRLPEDGDFRCLEVNTIPGMTPLSLVPMAARATGVSFEELVERIAELGIARGAKRAVPEGARP